MLRRSATTRFFWRRAPPPLSGRVVLFGAANSVGQPLALLLKRSPHVRELVCCGSTVTGDATAVEGVVADLSHIDTSTVVRVCSEEANWGAALDQAQTVIVAVGSSGDPLREDRDIALKATAPLVLPIMEAISGSMRGRADGRYTPVTAVVSSPLNALLPFCAEILKRDGCFDPRKLLGVTSLDVIRARHLVAEVMGLSNPYDVVVPVVGGRGGNTACPLFTQTGLRLSSEAIVHVTMEVQRYGTPFVATTDASSQGGSLTTAAATSSVGLGLAYSSFDFITSIMKAQRGDVGITECAFVESSVRPETTFFASRVQLGKEGVERLLPLGAMSAYELDLVKTSADEVAQDVQTGINMFKSLTSTPHQ